MKSKKLEIEIPEGKTAVWRNGILTLIDEPEKDVRKRIKTFEDACREIGIDAEAWNRDKISLGLEPDVLAFLKLRIIVKALNEGWEPQFTEDECRYYPWFILYKIKFHFNCFNKLIITLQSFKIIFCRYHIHTNFIQETLHFFLFVHRPDIDKKPRLVKFFHIFFGNKRVT